MTAAYDPSSDAPVGALVPPRRPVALAWTSVLCSVGLLAASLVLVDSKQVVSLLESTNPRWLVAFFATYLVEVALLGWRWSNIANQLDVPLSWARGSAEYALSMLVNQLLPTGFAGDGLRAMRHARRCRSRRFPQILEALALDRLSGQLGLGLFVLASLPLTLQAKLVQERSAVIGLVAAGSILFVVALLLYRVPRSQHLLSPVRGFVSRAARLLLSPRRAAIHLPLSLAVVAGLLLQLYFAARAVGVSLDWHLLFWLGSLVLLAASMPSFFGGWGVREGASALLFAGAGLHGSTGVAVSLVFGAFLLVCALPGFVVLLWDAFERDRPAP